MERNIEISLQKNTRVIVFKNKFLNKMNMVCFPEELDYFILFATKEIKYVYVLAFCILMTMFCTQQIHCIFNERR